MFLHFLQSKAHKEAFLDLAHLVAEADGCVNRKEQGFISGIMAELDWREPYAVKKDRQLADIVGSLDNEQVKNVFFAEMLLLMFADGDYNDEEKLVVSELRRLFGYTDEAYATFRDWVIRMDQLKIEGVKLILGTP
ncbi:TerB family tellurite resistance protein [Paenibacillus methanolicus]|uniref:Tellurite resistance protein TerB n=1 Tax=Paenibacillus methanolicus TaxID=582686 RepID=A0A5S5C203_9BACL|nr:TerB family tellurite resistance protein [Paenibacillus methanolicus]TYP72456.1 hypothetical protein BCM02_108110 [Paenibacillus methanolicus]